MKKQIACTECKGSGYITLTRMYDDLCGIGCKPCPSCNGTGFHEVDMTNAERIRAMSDEELAKWLCQWCTCVEGYCPGVKMCVFSAGKANGLLKWLQQPAEDE